MRVSISADMRELANEVFDNIHSLQSRLDLLSVVDRQLKQAADVVITTQGGAGRLQAAQEMATLQNQLSQLAQEALLNAGDIKQCSNIIASGHLEDLVTYRKVAQCARLIQQEQLLDAYTSLKLYNRLHPRYAVKS